MNQLFYGHNKSENVIATITLPSGSSSASSVLFAQLSVVTSGINMTVRWGDGSIQEFPSGSASNVGRTYADSSEKTIEILSSSPIDIINTTDEFISDVNLNNVITRLGTGISLINCALSSATVNKILIDLDRSPSVAGLINLHSQVPSAPPTGAGLTARTSLIAKGLTVNTD